MYQASCYVPDILSDRHTKVENHQKQRENEKYSKWLSLGSTGLNTCNQITMKFIKIRVFSF